MLKKLTYEETNKTEKKYVSPGFILKDLPIRIQTKKHDMHANKNKYKILEIILALGKWKIKYGTNAFVFVNLCRNIFLNLYEKKYYK